MNQVHAANGLLGEAGPGVAAAMRPVAGSPGSAAWPTRPPPPTPHRPAGPQGWTPERAMHGPVWGRGLASPAPGAQGASIQAMTHTTWIGPTLVEITREPRIVGGDHVAAASAGRPQVPTRQVSSSSSSWRSILPNQPFTRMRNAFRRANQ
mmetsp:Transcript_6493/g.14205  ORF Transcript_6493/g.14205 Transcript_6493/m.14205 type:complete len:151 (-) Transcript_6493:16-468(-)